MKNTKSKQRRNVSADFAENSKGPMYGTKRTRRRVSTMAQVMFKLDCLFRQDNEANVFVGFVPALSIFTQASTRERLEPALESAISQYILACHKRKLLDSVLSKLGFASQPDMDIHQEAKDEKSQFIAVFEEIAEELPNYEKLTVSVPMPLAA